MAKISNAPRSNIQHKTKLHHNNAFESDFNQYSTKKQQRESRLVQGTSIMRHQILQKLCHRQTAIDESSGIKYFYQA